MDRPGHLGTNFFIGQEVEHTPAYGLKTLFVVGVQNVTEISTLAQQYEVEHIYFGANQSFPRMGTTDRRWFDWEDMIKPLLVNGYLCTLDIDVSQVEGLVEGSLVEYTTFIPMISVKLPHIKQLGYNATIKLDDVDFQATNPGVWCHSLHDLQSRSAFTDWSRYTKDETL